MLDIIYLILKGIIFDEIREMLLMDEFIIDDEYRFKRKNDNRNI